MFIGNIEVFGIIYRIKNLVNNKVYIGQCIHPFKRRYKGKRWWDYTHNSHLKNSYNKYGITNFEVTEILDIAFSQDELDIKECMWIRLYNSDNPKFGYNKCSGGNSPKLSNDSRRKISIKSKARWQDPLYRNNIMTKLKIVTSSPDYRRNMSKSLNNSIPHKIACSSDEFKLKQSNKMKSLWSNEDFSNMLKLKAKEAWTDERKIEQGIRSKALHQSKEHNNKIRKNFKDRWDDDIERKLLCDSMKKIYLLIDCETNQIKEFLGREELANYLGKSISYVKTRLNGKLHDNRYKIVRKSDFIIK